MTVSIDPGQDLDGILISWLNMNLAKSQSGAFIPLSIAKYEGQPSSKLDYFVVTAKENF